MSEDADARLSGTPNAAEQLLWSLYRIGGTSRWVDVEELYLAAFEASPARLGWRTRPDLPDYKKCAKALQQLEDPKRSPHSGATLKQGRYLRRLSTSGADWCERHSEILTDRYSAPLPSARSQDDGRLLSDLTNSDAFLRFVGAEDDAIDMWALAEALRCLPDSSAATWAARFVDLTRAARRNQREDILQFLAMARQRLDEAMNS